jgi:hypothetical protein
MFCRAFLLYAFLSLVTYCKVVTVTVKRGVVYYIFFTVLLYSSYGCDCFLYLLPHHLYNCKPDSRRSVLG